MKKVLIIIILINLLVPQFIRADELLNITNDSNIKYRWYKEEKYDKKYYPKGLVLSGYQEDSSDLRFDGYSEWAKEYCNFDKKKYTIERTTEYKYKKIKDIRYIKFTNIKNLGNYTIKVYSNKNELVYNTISRIDTQIIIDLKKEYSLNDLYIYIDEIPYVDVFLANNVYFITISAYKHFENNRLLLPNNSWIISTSDHEYFYTTNKQDDNDFIFLEDTKDTCRIKLNEATLRYKIKKNYVEGYHTYKEGYLPDLDDYIVEYKGSLPTKLINSTIIQKEFVPIKEFINVPVSDGKEKSSYMVNDKNDVEIEKSSILNEEKKNIDSEEHNFKEVKYIENTIYKNVYKIPQYIYVLICLFLLIIFVMGILYIKMSKKINI